MARFREAERISSWRRAVYWRRTEDISDRPFRGSRRTASRVCKCVRRCPPRSAGARKPAKIAKVPAERRCAFRANVRRSACAARTQRGQHAFGRKSTSMTCGLRLCTSPRSAEAVACIQPLSESCGRCSQCSQITRSPGKRSPSMGPECKCLKRRRDHPRRTLEDEWL